MEAVLVEEGKLKVRFSGEAKHWTDALPIGNGRLGGMVWGGVFSEPSTSMLRNKVVFSSKRVDIAKLLVDIKTAIFLWIKNRAKMLSLEWEDWCAFKLVARPSRVGVFSFLRVVIGTSLFIPFATLAVSALDDTLWTGSPGNYTNPDAPKALSEVRKLVNDGKYAEATTSAVKLSGEASNAYQLLGDINLNFHKSDTKYNQTTYRRELDLDTATVKVIYSIDEVEFTRQHFASHPDQVIVSKISGNKTGSLSFTMFLDSKIPHRTSLNAQNQIIMERTEDGIKFSAVLDLRISDGIGTISVFEDNKIKVEGCDWAVILLVASSSFEGPFTNPSDSKKDPTNDCLNKLKSLKRYSYEQLYSRHLHDYQNLFHRVSINLSNSSKFIDNYVATSERIKSFKTDEDPSLIELLFQYGRYLLISCSRPGTQPANLQGIWNDKLTPPWDGAPHLNINLQMNYWHALACNLHECQEPLFDFINHLSVNGSKTAKVNYGANGWVAHQVSDIWAKTSPDRGEAVWALWPMGGAWLCTHLWEHYTYTMNKEFLATKAYPLLEGCVLFLLDWLIEGQDEYLQTNPSTSPEHMFTAPDGQPASVSYSTTMDMSIIKEVFSAIVSAAQVLGKSEDDLIKKVVESQSKLYSTQIATDGSIMEWAQDFVDPDLHHRHISHLFGLFPGHMITLEETPDLCKAAENTLIKRGEEGPGWSTTWKAASWARLHNSEHAYQMVKHLFDLVDPENESNYEGGLYSNLFTAHPPFQIDANFGFSAVIAEMLIQSSVTKLYLLPALPRDKWRSGSVKGLKARGNVSVSILWSDGDLNELIIWSDDRENQRFTKTIHYKDISVVVTMETGKVYTFDGKLKTIKTVPLLDSSRV